MFELVYIFTGAFISALCLCWAYGKCGGDESWIQAHPHLKSFLHIFHHWEIGIAILILSGYFYYVLRVPPQVTIGLLGWGFGLSIDDMLYHSFDNTFCKKFKLREDCDG